MIWTGWWLFTSPWPCSSLDRASSCAGDAIRRRSPLALWPRMVARVVQVLEADDVALVVNEWNLTGIAPDGSEVHQGGRSADVVRRQPDGSWLVLVDKP